jgi:hypothetical protein
LQQEQQGPWLGLWQRMPAAGLLLRWQGRQQCSAAVPTMGPSRRAVAGLLGWQCVGPTELAGVAVGALWLPGACAPALSASVGRGSKGVT